jgi:hypothetical protein
MAKRQPHPISTLRRTELIDPELRARVQACRKCTPDKARPEFTQLCPDHLIEDVFARL